MMTGFLQVSPYRIKIPCGFAKQSSWTGKALLPWLLGLLVSAHAQEGIEEAVSPDIEEIIVTADFRQRRRVEVPLSLTVVQDEEIGRRSSVHLESLIALAPNVSLSSGASRGRYYQIRGIGERGQFEKPLVPSVGLLVDDVDFSGAGAAGVLFDVAQVEFLRGPQGTRYGSNAMAGLISVRTHAPSAEREIRIKAGVSDDDGWSLELAAGGPLTDRLFYRIAAHGNYSDGFIRNTHLSRDDTNRIDERAGRVKLGWLASDSLTVDMHLSRVDADNGYDAFSLDNDRRTRSDEPGRDRRTSDSGGLKFNWEGEVMDVAMMATFSASKVDYGYDEDWSHAGFHPDGYSSTDRYERDRSTRSLEIRLLRDDNARVNLVAGAYALSTATALTRYYTYFPEPFASDYEVDLQALFGEVDVALTPRLSLAAGLRVERWSADYEDSEQVDLDPGNTLWGGRLALEWSLSASALAYMSVAQGYKTGGFNIDGTLGEDLRGYDSETLWNLELGVQGDWFERQLSGSLALFLMTRKDVQIDSSISLVREDGSSEFIGYTGNAADGRNHGLEAELRWFPSGKWKISGGLGLLSTEYRDFVNSQGEDLSGRDQAHAPEYQYHLAIEYRPRDRWYVGLELDGQDAFYFSDGHQARASSHDLVHVRFGYEADKWSVVFWGRNITDEIVQTRGFFFGNDPRNGYAQQAYVQLGEPRRYGISVDVSF